MDSSTVRRLRLAMNMTQQQFAQALGMSIGSVRAYEAGAKVSDGTLEKMRKLAAQQMLPDLALELDTKKYVPQPTTGHRVRMPNAKADDLGAMMHGDLERVLESGDSETISTVATLLRWAARSGLDKPRSRGTGGHE